ncbi:MAG: XRE family transcriptional regulator [Planctomycetota bacterium]|nr:MAG: XRE family transcriptional regulator [Planctomycetota bacterium]
MTSASISTSSAFGERLRFWRNARSVSQLQLAMAANVSSRHVSFLETGRSKPSRQMVMQIAEVLDVPLRERNALLDAAGFAPAYRASNLDSEHLATVRHSLEFLLERHDPYPAVVVDRHWNLLLQNRASQQLLRRFVLSAESLVAPLNVMHVLFREDGMRPFVVNWNELTAAMVSRLQREANSDPADAQCQQLLSMALEACGGAGRTPQMEFAADSPAMLEMRLRRDDVELGLFSTITTLGTPLDVTLQELRLETFFPTDDASEQVIKSLVE